MQPFIEENEDVSPVYRFKILGIIQELRDQVALLTASDFPVNTPE